MVDATTAMQEVYSDAPGGQMKQRGCSPWWTGMRSHVNRFGDGLCNVRVRGRNAGYAIAFIYAERVRTGSRWTGKHAWTTRVDEGWSEMFLGL